MNKLLLFPIVLLSSCASAQFPKSLKDATNILTNPSSLSNDDVIAGLKEALNKGAEHGVSLASVADGFNKNARIRIPFPAEAEKMKSTLISIGMQKQVDEFEVTMNHAAEEATKEAVAVFVGAIKDMSVSDGFAILKGSDNAATNFLKDKTTNVLQGKFLPIVKRATEKVALTNYWTPLANAYNSASMFTGGHAVDPDLNAYVTQRAIGGLFTLIADEEQNIRKDPLARTTDLLKRVFAQH